MKGGAWLARPSLDFEDHMCSLIKRLSCSKTLFLLKFLPGCVCVCQNGDGLYKRWSL